VQHLNLPHVHLLLNHLPIIGTFIAFGLFAVSLIGKRTDLRQASLALFALLALLAIPTYMSGDAAHEALKDSPDLSKDLIETHQGAAFLAFVFMEITGGFALIGLWPFSRTEKRDAVSSPARWNLTAVLLFSLVTMGLMAVAGNTGGAIRHPEIVSGPETASTVGTAGARIVALIHHLVIDTSMWVWPVLEDLHFLGLILLIGATGAFNLRILGCFKRLRVAPLHRFIPWGIAGFVVNIITGIFFFMGMPGFYTPNIVFQLKMFTIAIAGGSLLLFYCTSAFRTLEHLGPGDDAPLIAKVIAGVTLFLWIFVIVLGRYIPWGEVT
jgi:hypothetical protein